MPAKRGKAILLFFVSLLSFIDMKAQAGVCPPNIDFENGDFSNWLCKSGIVKSIGGVNTLMLTDTGQLVNRHTIISRATAGRDYYGQFPEICPNGSNYSVKLGNAIGGAQAESISYMYTIPSSVPNFSLLCNFAMVLYDGGHPPDQQPMFRAKVTDLSTNSVVPCVTFEFIVAFDMPGFQYSPITPWVKYRDWTPMSMNLSKFIGKTVQIEFTTSDCTQSQHWGYAYIDINSNCNDVISGTTICQGDINTTLTAPFGFESYKWYADNSFSTVLSTSQNLVLNPVPAMGSSYPVIVTPYIGFGCDDTIYANINNTAVKPVSVAGTDKSLCKYETAQLGAPPTAGYLYKWSPASQVIDSFSSQPSVRWSPTGQTHFIVKTTDISSGCFSFDTVMVTSKIVDTAIRLNGSASFCDYGIPGATLFVNNISSEIQWYNDNVLISGANLPSYQPMLSGNYWAQLMQQGCMDSTKAIPVAVHPLPVSSFSIANDTGCVTNNSFLFANGSSVPDNSALTYHWKFSDGNTISSMNAVKSFSTVGTYGVELVATSAFGCMDSISNSVYVLPNGNPDFTWDSGCVNRPVVFMNLSVENNSPLVKYKWQFNNGGPDVTTKNPAPVNYTHPGKVDVTLLQINLGCEDYSRTITKDLRINDVHAGVRYKSITVPQENSWPIHVRDSIGNVYNWKPAIQLSSYNKQYTEFFATGNDVTYLIDITDGHACITTDTLLMQVLKNPGYYLPSAFTPNGDGLNDIIKPYLVGMKELKSFSIFNRWGNLIFFSKKEGEGWDGKFKGIDQPTGAYVWILEFYNIDNVLVKEKGTITLIR